MILQRKTMKILVYEKGAELYVPGLAFVDIALIEHGLPLDEISKSLGASELTGNITTSSTIVVIN